MVVINYKEGTEKLYLRVDSWVLYFSFFSLVNLIAYYLFSNSALLILRHISFRTGRYRRQQGQQPPTPASHGWPVFGQTLLEHGLRHRQPKEPWPEEHQ